MPGKKQKSKEWPSPPPREGPSHPPSISLRKGWLACLAFLLFRLLSLSLCPSLSLSLSLCLSGVSRCRDIIAISPWPTWRKPKKKKKKKKRKKEEKEEEEAEWVVSGEWAGQRGDGGKRAEGRPEKRRAEKMEDGRWQTWNDSNWTGSNWDLETGEPWHGDSQ
ncbi:uncharacterized protein ARB_04122 [Trichophyton benhamiae CBS 112371]|uniref:Uncharacterized protein n=1 Tax=Arthroderma benhamiae (strain ATCC MYA-4681 / CBS 112371) TaxID=663331 RepID=D4AIM7_ARTBC|nr:uncharacterized protein ARB_04122 [Trichophyton benhamiae CBS 112371]EFE36600.1 hypothetical protein ARB_04122 [Trichophyton benhamiae CBS 112371]